MGANGYAWWYVDALSDDGVHGLTLIAFIGSVFSPYYAFARRRGPADPLDHCALNVALYTLRGQHWSMTERPKTSVSRTATRLAIGPSEVTWDGRSLVFQINEVTAPLPSRLRGTVRVEPAALFDRSFVLSESGNHRWWPIAPVSRVQVRMEAPHLSWQGDGYFDSNFGDAPLEEDFIDWQWARGADDEGTRVVYEARRRDGSKSEFAGHFRHDGSFATFAPPALVPLPPTGWRIGRDVRSAAPAKVVRTVTSAPFYARSVVQASTENGQRTFMHESLSLDRFRNPVVQMMLPFRVPRARR